MLGLVRITGSLALVLFSGERYVWLRTDRGVWRKVEYEAVASRLGFGRTGTGKGRRGVGREGRPMLPFTPEDAGLSMRANPPPGTATHSSSASSSQDGKYELELPLLEQTCGFSSVAARGGERVCVSAFECDKE